MSVTAVLTQIGLAPVRFRQYFVIGTGPLTSIIYDPRGVIEAALFSAVAEALEPSRQFQKGWQTSILDHIATDIDDAVATFLLEYRGKLAACYGSTLAHPEEHYRIGVPSGEVVPAGALSGTHAKADDGYFILGSLLPYRYLLKKIEGINDDCTLVVRRSWIGHQLALLDSIPASSVARAVANFSLDRKNPVNRVRMCPEVYAKLAVNSVVILESIFPTGREEMTVKDFMESFESYVRGWWDQSLVRRASEGILLKWQPWFDVKYKDIDGVRTAVVFRKQH